MVLTFSVLRFSAQRKFYMFFSFSFFSATVVAPNHKGAHCLSFPILRTRRHWRRVSGSGQNTCLHGRVLILDRRCYSLPRLASRSLLRCRAQASEKITAAIRGILPRQCPRIFSPEIDAFQPRFIIPSFPCSRCACIPLTLLELHKAQTCIFREPALWILMPSWPLRS